MKFSYTNHKGIAPKIADHLLPDTYAVVAENCDLHRGDLRAMRNNLVIRALESTSQVETIFYYLSSYWFEFETDVDIQYGPIPADTSNRIYWTGDGIPKKTNETEATTGSGVYPISFYPIGVPTPAVAPTATLGAGGTGTARDVNYVWTVVTSWGEESVPSDASNIVSALQGQTVNLTAMSMVWATGKSYYVGDWVFPTISTGFVYRCVTAGTAGGSEPAWVNTQDQDTIDNTVTWRTYKDDILTGSAAEKRIYRSNAGSIGASWQLLDTIGITETVYADSTTDDDLGTTVLPSEVWSPPPDNMIGLCSLSNGSFAAFYGKDIYLSEPYYPHAWPYTLSVGHDIVGLAVVGNALVVLTVKNPVIFVGSHPDSMTPKNLPQPKKCLSKTGIANFPGGVLYPSIDGIEWINGTDIQTITQDRFSKDEWENYYPSTMKAVFHRNRYHGFYTDSEGDGHCIIIDTITGDITTADIAPDAVYVDNDSDTLYYLTAIEDVILQRSGITYPNRTNSLLLRSGDKLMQR